MKINFKSQDRDVVYMCVVCVKKKEYFLVHLVHLLEALSN